ncbi:PLAC8 family-domain-containing protein [Aspergillus multicolor]|uniref:PLAC8 family protein n=1 Tax=Aspergillus multicolor TaxID=41759 RepID=UPI003CCD8014
MSNEWNNSVWSCFSPIQACFMSWCCPCMLYGKQSERLEDPGLKEGSNVNGDVSLPTPPSLFHPLIMLRQCCLFLLANCCGLQWVLMMMKRRDMREKFGIKGSVGGDCILSCCCSCCVLVQQEKELDAQMRRFQTVGSAGYQPPPVMTYNPEGGYEPGTAVSPGLEVGVNWKK